jgi:hypothetical protein
MVQPKVPWIESLAEDKHSGLKCREEAATCSRYVSFLSEIVEITDGNTFSWQINV